MYNVGIVGYGFVGKGIHRLFKEEIKAIYDPLIAKDDLNDGKFIAQSLGYKENFDDKTLFSTIDLVVVCVPTPTSADGISADVYLVEESINWLKSVIKTDCRILIKSTVPPTILKEYLDEYGKVVFSPEYMGESKYFTPPWKYPDPIHMESHSWQVFGGQKEDTSFCVDVFKRRMGVDTVFMQTDILTAGLAKYMENSFFAMKVTFCNEWFDIANAYGVDYNTLRECWLADPRINRNHTLVFPKDRGYGGKCFPKDTKAIISDVATKGYEAKLMKAMDKYNNDLRGGRK